LKGGRLGGRGVGKEGEFEEVFVTPSLLMFLFLFWLGYFPAV